MITCSCEDFSKHNWCHHMPQMAVKTGWKDPLTTLLESECMQDENNLTWMEPPSKAFAFKDGFIRGRNNLRQAIREEIERIRKI